MKLPREFSFSDPRRLPGMNPGWRGCRRPPSRRPVWPGFTVIELLVAVSVLSLIVLVLYGIFDQTQKALRGNASQVDVLEGGRAATELMAREIEQVMAGGVRNNLNLYVALTSAPRRQVLPGVNAWRTNVLQELYFLSHSNKTWIATGYRILSATNRLADEGIGWLAKFSVAGDNYDFQAMDPFWRVMNPNPTNLVAYQRVTDGLVHFRVRAFDSVGQPMTFWTNRFRFRNVALWEDRRTEETACIFTNTAVPAYLEVEMGVLESQALDRFRSIRIASVRSNYLARQANRVHLFQQRIPIRTAPLILPQ